MLINMNSIFSNNLTVCIKALRFKLKNTIGLQKKLHVLKILVIDTQLSMLFLTCLLGTYTGC